MARGTCLFALAAAAGQKNPSQARSAKGVPAAGGKVSKQKVIFWVVPATHGEDAVFKTPQEYLGIGFPIILKALRILEAHPECRFVL